MEEDKEKTIYLVQIQHLDRQLESLQLRCDGLQQQNQDLVLGCGALATDQKDICEFLQHSLQPDLQLQLLQEKRRQAAAQEHRALDQLLGGQLQELQDRVQQLEAETATRAALFEEQQQELEEQEQRLHLLTEQQSGMQREEEALLHQQEALQAALRLQEETLSMEASASQTQVRIQDQDQVQVLVLEERARQVQHLEAFQTLLAQNEALWTKKAALKEQQVELLHQGGVLREDRQAIRHKNHTHNTELENLSRRSLKLKEKLNDCSSAHEPLLEEEETLRQLLTVASKERRQKAAEADRLRAELQRERSGSRRLEAGVQEAVAVLGHILEDSEKTFRTEGERLLEILQSSAILSLGSTPEEGSDTQGPGSTPKESRAPKKDRTKALATDPLFLLARYRPGDLGFIPRPSWTRKAAASRQKLCRQKRSGADKEAFTAANC
ncbi:cilia- and flagella-associated protein 157-like [Clinocottus analis]|uniref:cilia- and flagella-associated protein 157-like n=1 Tax=Clinocottus analis TaxID=304258 RepID=UPI0035C0F087